jgi:hypothetical protein
MAKLLDEMTSNPDFMLFMLDLPISFHRPYIPLTGRVTAALMLSWSVQISEESRDPDGWFAKTNDEWRNDIGLSRDELITARKRLVELGLLWVRPCVQTQDGQMRRCNEYRVDFDRLHEALLAQAEAMRNGPVATGCH